MSEPLITAEGCKVDVFPWTTGTMVRLRVDDLTHWLVAGEDNTVAVGEVFGREATVFLTPDEARQFAAALLEVSSE